MGEVTGAMGERNTAIKLFGKTICPWQEGEPPASVEEEGDVAKKETSPGFQNVKQEKEEEEEDDVKREENESSIDNSLENCQKSAKTLPCPRCSSKDTKFCYYNNYSIKQPRYFCKNCLRYWTSGGVMRNLPVGAGRRKNKPPSCTTAIPNDSHHPLKSNETVLSFESPPLKRGKEDRDHQFSGVNGTPCPYPFNFPVHFYPTTTYWNIPCLSPPLTSCTSSCSELNSTKLGKHSRNGEKLIYQSTADSLKVMYANPVPLSLSLSLKFQESS